MKKLTTLITLLITAITTAQSPWNFEGTSSTYNWDNTVKVAAIDPAVEGEIQVNFVKTLADDEITFIDTNPYIQNDNLGILQADAAANTIMAITMKASSADIGIGHLRITYPKKSNPAKKSNIGEDIAITDTEFHTYYINISGNEWGVVGHDESMLRINFKGPGNSGYTIAETGDFVIINKIEFLNEIPLPSKTEYNFTNDNEGWTSSGFCNVVAGSGTLNMDLLPDNAPASNQFSEISNSSYNVDADTYKYAYIHYKNLPETVSDVNFNSSIKFTASTINGSVAMSTGITQNMQESDAFEVAEIPLMNSEKWNGTANTFKISLKNEAYQEAQGFAKGSTTPGTLIIEKIIFTMEQVLATANIQKDDTSSTVYPNPASNTLHIVAGNIEKVEIFTVLGKKVLDAYTNTIDVSSLSNGLYIAKIHQENGGVSSKTFVKN